MPIDRNIILTGFTKEHIPAYRCPHCEIGHLRLMEGTFHDEWPDHDRLAYDHHLVEEGIRIRFTGLLKCTNEPCGEIISFSGTGVPQEVFYDDPQRGYEYEWVTHFFPKFFNPPIDLFPLWQFDLPQEVSKAVIASFKLFWCDLPSCVSKLRLTVERILDDKEIPTQTPKGRRYNLHQRIDIFKEQVNDDLGDFLEAIKWLGNEGTHENNTEKHEVMDAFDMIEHVFEHLYRVQGNQARLRAARDQINERNRRN